MIPNSSAKIPLLQCPIPSALFLALLTLTVATPSTAQDESKGEPTAIMTEAIVDRTVVNPDEHLTLRILLFNGGGTPLTKRSLGELSTSGFTQLGPVRQIPPPNIPLQPGTTAVFEVDLAAGDQPGSFKLSALLMWQAEKEPGSRMVTTPPEGVTIEKSWFGSHKPWFQEIILPIFFTLLAAFVPWWFNHLRQQRSEYHETYKQMLARVLDLSKHHYMPIGRASRDFLRQYRKFSEDLDNEENLSQCFAALIVLLRLGNTFHEEAGGWILQDLQGEAQVFYFWGHFQQDMITALGPHQRLARLLNYVEDKPRVAQLLDRFDGDHIPAVGLVVVWREVKDKFRNWAQGKPSELPLAKVDVAPTEEVVDILEGFTNLLLVETNRAYAPLYGPESFPAKHLAPDFKELASLRDKLQSHLKRLNNDAQRETQEFADRRKKIEELHKGLKSYLNENKPGTFCWRTRQKVNKYWQSKWPNTSSRTEVKRA